MGIIDIRIHIYAHCIYTPRHLDLTTSTVGQLYEYTSHLDAHPIISVILIGSCRMSIRTRQLEYGAWTSLAARWRWRHIAWDIKTHARVTRERSASPKYA